MKTLLLIAFVASAAGARPYEDKIDHRLPDCEDLYDGDYDDHTYRASPRTECVNTDTEDENKPQVQKLEQYLGDENEQL